MPESLDYEVSITYVVKVSTSAGPGQAARLGRDAILSQSKLTDHDDSGNLVHTDWPEEHEVNIRRVTP